MHVEIVVIGGGIGGYTAALEAAHNGLSVSLIEAGGIGGTCLNVGCIPTKSLLESAKIWSRAHQRGWIVSSCMSELEWATVQQEKDVVVKKLTSGVTSLLERAGVKVVQGYGQFVNEKEIIVSKAGDTQRFYFDRAIIATGSKVSIPPIPGVNEIGVYTSDEILSLRDIPKRIIIIGGGVIGIEFASLFRQLSSQVVVIEFVEEILSNSDRKTVKYLKEILRRQEITFYTNTAVQRIKRDDLKGDLQVYASREDSSVIQMNADAVLLATGRVQNIERLGLETTKIEMDEGRIIVDRYCRTSQPDIYAIGDCASEMMLAHVAMADAHTAVADILGKVRSKGNRYLIPQCVYSQPEMASVGMTEEEVKMLGVRYQVSEIPLRANGRALIEKGDGICRLIFETQTGIVLGVHMIGPNVTEVIQEAVVALQLEGTIRELTEVVHAHPTISEVLHEAAWLGIGTPIHVSKREVLSR